MDSGMYHSQGYMGGFDRFVFFQFAYKQEEENKGEEVADPFTQPDFPAHTHEHGWAEDVVAGEAEGHDGVFGFAFGTCVEGAGCGGGTDAGHEQEQGHTLAPGDGGTAYGDAEVCFTEFFFAACLAHGGADTAEDDVAFKGGGEAFFIAEVDDDGFQAWSWFEGGGTEQDFHFAEAVVLQEHIDELTTG